MIDIAVLIPHAGAMVLLQSVTRWDEAAIVCLTRTHLDAENPLRRAGMLAIGCGVEYGLQAAALHGALRAGGQAQSAGYLAALRHVVFAHDRLDDPAIGTLTVEAQLEAQETFGMVYALALADPAGRILLHGRASIALPR